MWAGRELLVWGGNTANDAVHHADGWGYEAATAGWSALPSAPLAERSSPGIAWTGSEAIVWGGRGYGDNAYGDGAAYAPASKTWRQLPPAPLSRREPLATVWTGREVVVWGASRRASPRRDGAAYDPTSDRWRRIREAPFALNEASAVWTGQEVVVVGALLDAFNASASEHARALAYRPESNTWRVVPDPPLSPQAVSAAWTGREVVSWDYVLDAAAYRPGDDGWRRLPRLPLDEMEAWPQSAVVGSALFGWYSGQAAALDLRTETWTRLQVPRAARNAVLVPADRAVLLLAPTTLYAFRP